MVYLARVCVRHRLFIPVVHVGNLRLTFDNLESVVISRLELDPQSPEYVFGSDIYLTASNEVQP